MNYAGMNKFFVRGLNYVYHEVITRAPSADGDRSNLFCRSFIKLIICVARCRYKRQDIYPSLQTRGREAGKIASLRSQWQILIRIQRRGREWTMPGWTSFSSAALTMFIMKSLRGIRQPTETEVISSVARL